MPHLRAHKAVPADLEADGSRPDPARRPQNPGCHWRPPDPSISFARSALPRMLTLSACRAIAVGMR